MLYKYNIVIIKNGDLLSRCTGNSGKDLSITTRTSAIHQPWFVRKDDNDIHDADNHGDVKWRAAHLYGTS